MKKLIRPLAIATITTSLTLPAFAQNTQTPTTTGTTATQGATSDAEAKRALYTRLYENYEKNPAVAYEAAQEYVRKFPNDKDEQAQYARKFIVDYEKTKSTQRVQEFTKLIYTTKDYPAAFTMGKEMLAAEPDNLSTLINLSYAGYLAAASKNKSFNADASGYAKRAISLIESGKSPDGWSPFKTKEETLAYLNFAYGFLNVETAPSDTAPYFVRAAGFETPLKKEPSTYYLLGIAYESGDYAKLSEEYKPFLGQPESPESKAVLDRLNPVVDRIIDAYARAVALAGTQPKFQQQKTEWMKQLEGFYKFRNKNSTTGMNELIASVVSKPLPQPVSTTTAPTTTPANTTQPTTTTDGASTTTGNTPAASTTTTPATSTSPAATATPATGTRPAATTTTPATQPTPTTRPATNGTRPQNPSPRRP